MTGNEACKLIMEQVNSVIAGKEAIVKKIMTAIIAGGHILLEDIPGVGKTTMAKAFSKAMSLENRRMQFTTDVMPSDIMGFTIFDRKTNEFVYKPGVVMCNLLLADEINRTSAKTQAALLEVMEEGCVTVDGETRKVPEPFLVIATQNPIGSIGTSMLPESQMDRFMFKLSMGYPDKSDEMRMIQERQEETNELKNVRQIIDSTNLKYIQEEVGKVYIHERIIEYIVELVNRTRNDYRIALGISPRGTLAIVNAAKAYAYLEGRDYVIPDDVRGVFPEAAIHRVILSGKGQAEGLTMERFFDEILEEIKAKR